MVKTTGSGDNYSLHQIFLAHILNDPNYTPALSQLWLAGFNTDSLKNVANYSSNLVKKYEGEPTWKLKTAWDTGIIEQGQYKAENGFVLAAAGVNFPGDSTNISRAGLSNFGSFKGLIGGGREDPVICTIDFYETNISIVDSLFRPWMVACGYNSLKDANLRIPEISLYCFRKQDKKAIKPNVDVISDEERVTFQQIGASNNIPQNFLEMRKIITLKNAVPVNIDSEEQNYTGDKIIQRQVQFAYDYYTIETAPKIESSDPLNFQTTPRIADIIEQAQRLYISTKNAADQIEQGVTTVLRATNQNKLANKVDQSYNKATAPIFSPVAKVITTGSTVKNAADVASKKIINGVNIQTGNTVK